MNKCDSAAIVTLLELSNEFLLSDLGLLCEGAAAQIVSLDNIGKFMLLCARYNSLVLREACRCFVADHGTALRQVRVIQFISFKSFFRIFRIASIK